MPPSLFLTETRDGRSAAAASEMANWANRNLENEAEAHQPVRAVPVCGFGSAAVTNEELRLVQKLFFLTGREAPKVAVFCGVESTDRSELVCARVAEVLASLVKEPVCLMDANFESPTLHSRYKIDEVLRTIDRRSDSEQESDVSGPYLWVLPASPAKDGHSRLTPDKLRDRLSRLRRMFGFLLISAPPLNTALEGLLLGQMADGVVLTVLANSTPRAMALKVRSNLETYNVRMLGAVLNQAPG